MCASERAADDAAPATCNKTNVPSTVRCWSLWKNLPALPLLSWRQLAVVARPPPTWAQLLLLPRMKLTLQHTDSPPLHRPPVPQLAVMALLPTTWADVGPTNDEYAELAVRRGIPFVGGCSVCVLTSNVLSWQSCEAKRS